MSQTPWGALGKPFPISIGLLILCCVTSINAYEYPLLSETIRQAYFFDRSSDGGKVLEFLGQYIRLFGPTAEFHL
jgi:hypothetical protein